MITRTRARTPGAVVIPLHGGARSSPWPDTVRDNPVTTRCTKGGCKPAVTTRMSGADLSFVTTGKAPLESQPSSRTGENPPYGMIGGIEETSASCEARSAPRSYPTGERQASAAGRSGDSFDLAQRVVLAADREGRGILSEIGRIDDPGHLGRDRRGLAARILGRHRDPVGA